MDRPLESPLHLRRRLGRLDGLVSHFVQSHRSEPATTVARVASAWWFRGLFMPGLVAAGDWRAQRPPTAAFRVGTALAGAHIAAEAAKLLTRRRRPSLTDDTLTALVKLPRSYSLPSGHAMSAFAVASAGGSFRPKLRLPLYGLAGLAASSRVYLGVHYLSDVVVGAVCGTGIGLFIAATAKRLDETAAADAAK